MTPSLKARLETLREDLGVLVTILAREQWVARWASNVSHAFGTGMGTLSDVFLGQDFEDARGSVQGHLWEIIVDARTATGLEEQSV